jgi:hypothetical protein
MHTLEPLCLIRYLLNPLLRRRQDNEHWSVGFGISGQDNVGRGYIQIS